MSGKRGRTIFEVAAAISAAPATPAAATGAAATANDNDATCAEEMPSSRSTFTGSRNKKKFREMLPTSFHFVLFCVVEYCAGVGSDIQGGV